MYAVIHTGGKQYKVEPGSKIRVEKIMSRAGDQVEITAVSLVRNEQGDLQLGTPWVEGARVMASVVRHSMGDKIRIFKKKRRKQFRRTTGHRQQYTELRIEQIESGQ